MVKVFGAAWKCNGSCHIWLMTVLFGRDRPNSTVKKPTCTCYCLADHGQTVQSCFRQPDVHHSEEKYLELLDSFNGVTETYHLTSLTVSTGVTEPYHLTLLDSFTWRYWKCRKILARQFWLGSSGAAGAFIPDRFHWKNISKVIP